MLTFKYLMIFGSIHQIKKWNILEKFKNKSEQEPEKIIQLEKNIESETILAEYNETLYSDRYKNIKESAHFEKNKVNSKQRIWRNLNFIEENINGLHKSKANTRSSNLDRKIDRLIARKQKK